MKESKQREEIAPFVTTDNLFEALGFSPAEALELKVRSEIYRELIRHIRERGLKQTELAKTLGIHQPDVSHLMNGRISKFSVGKLIQFAAKMDLNASIKVTKAKTKDSSATPAVANSKRRIAKAA